MLKFVRKSNTRALLRQPTRKFFSRDRLITDASKYVVEGTGTRVGLWLVASSATVLILAGLGGYTRNMKFGRPDINWRPHGRIPVNEEEWQVPQKDFHKYPDYEIQGKHVDKKTYKKVKFVNTLSKVLTVASPAIVTVPMVYFWTRGYFKAPMKTFSMIYLGLYALLGYQGYYSDTHRPGHKVNGELPPISPHQKALHLYLNFVFYGAGVWQAMNLLRPSPDSIKSLKHYFSNMALRRQVMFTSHLIFPLVLITGCLMAGTGAGRVIPTFPKVGDKWVIGKEDFDKNSTFWENLVQNRKVIHFNHRTLGMAMIAIGLGQSVYLLRTTNLNPMAKFALWFLCFNLLKQFGGGAYQVTHDMPSFVSMLHAATAYIIFTLFLYLTHTSRKPNSNVAKALAVQLQKADNTGYQELMKRFPKEMKRLSS